MSTSTGQRFKGNKAYKAGNLIGALRHYTTALKLADEGSSQILANISAVKFEGGDYSGALRAIAEALKGEKDETKRQQLRLRELRCSFHSGATAQAVNLVQELLECPGKDEVNEIKIALEREARAKKGPGKSNEEVWPIGRSIYRPKMHDAEGYFPRGHDNGEPLFSSADLLKRKQPLDLAILYGGVGDGRHFLAQIYHFEDARRQISKKAKKNGRARRKKGVHEQKSNTHFTLLDVSPYMLARTLLILRMLHDATGLATDCRNQTADEQKLLSTIWYIYAADIMPPYAFEILLATMRSLRDEDHGIPWLHMDKHTEQTIKVCYDRWLGPDKDRHSVRYALQIEIQDVGDNMNRLPYLLSKLDFEAQQFERTRVIFPPLGADPNERELHHCKDDPEMSTTGKCEFIRRHVERHWKVNMTLQDPRNEVDPIFSSQLDRWSQTEHFIDPMDRLIGESSVAFVNDLMGYTKGRGLIAPMEVMCVFFRGVAKSLTNLAVNDALIVEYRLGELNDFLDTVTFGGRDRANNFPKKYDAQCLNNVPDYTGGHLTMATHGAPTLAPDGFLRASHLLNASLFTGVSQSVAEYVGVPTLESAGRLLGLQIRGQVDINEWRELLELHRWGFLQPDPDKNLLPKSEIHNYLIHMFFHIALPTKRRKTAPKGIWTAVSRPLNVNAWIRLCYYLVVHRNYPPHWITALVTAILSGQVTTTARHATQSPIPLRHLTTQRQASVLSTAPYVPELRVLLAQQWLHLPFRISSLIPSHSDLVKVKFKFDGVMELTIQPTLALAFGEELPEKSNVSSSRIEILEMMHLPSISPPQKLWDTLMGDQKTEVVLFSAFEWSRGDKKATVWLEREAWQAMRDQEWAVALIETERWNVIAKHTQVGDGVETEV